jgi:hypothetical protein
MEWSWKVFFVTLPITIIFSMFMTGAANQRNVAKYGHKADFRVNPGRAVITCIFTGAVWAALITAIIGLF